MRLFIVRKFILHIRNSATNQVHQHQRYEYNFFHVPWFIYMRRYIDKKVYSGIVKKNQIKSPAGTELFMGFECFMALLSL